MAAGLRYRSAGADGGVYTSFARN
ncbi:hypothetical protein CBM2585_B20480 [Cupriavidus taiwanensis]|nr:hypothetical protein CBM2585_B20480 [Cupriavidus taiwanensis]